jgi:hypothetical protein
MPSPLYIEIGLHYHARVNDYRDGDFSAPAVREALDTFVRLGLLLVGTSDRRYEPTEGLRVWVDALCSVAFPEQRWVTDTPQSRGGRTRAEKLSPTRRREIATAAATARWNGGQP